MTQVRVASAAEIPAGSGKVVEVGGKTIAVFNCEGTFYAIDNTCVHRGGPARGWEPLRDDGHVPLARLGVRRADRGVRDG